MCADFHVIGKRLVKVIIPCHADPHPSCPSPWTEMTLFRGCVLALLVGASLLGSPPCRGNHCSQPIPFIIKACVLLWRIFRFDLGKPPWGSREQPGASSVSSALLCLEIMGFLTFTVWKILYKTLMLHSNHELIRSCTVCEDYSTQVCKRELDSNTKALFNFCVNADAFMEKCFRRMCYWA